MKNRGGRWAGAVVIAALAPVATAGIAAPPASFGSEVGFLRRHVNTIVLSEPGSGARVAVVPAYQGRVMTSTAGGSRGPSYGWINHQLVGSGKLVQHMNAFGGEDRFWLGPEGGQFGLFFRHGAPFDLAHWFTPAPVDTESYPVSAVGTSWARFRRVVQVTNYSNTHFRVGVDRTIRMLTPAAVWRDLRTTPQPGVRLVGYESENRVTNLGRAAWRRPTGLLSAWILGQYNPGPETTIVIPFRTGDNLGPIVNDAYFGKVPADRLIIKNGVIFFKGDGTYRSKIGIPPRRAKSTLGSYDAAAHVLTLIQLNDLNPRAGYVNSMWEIQKNPYGGDAVNSYNDGPPAPGKAPLGPFYELETSSPAAALAPGQSILHIHRTIHLQGPEAELNRIARATLGVSLQQIQSAFGH